MSTYRQLDALKLGARRLADLEEDDDFIDSDELTRYVNEGIADLFDAKVDANPSLFALNGPKLVSAGTNAWTLPSDLRQLVSVHVQYSGDYWTAQPLDISDYAWAASQDNWTEYQARYIYREEFGTGTKELYIFPSGIRDTDIAYTYVPEAPVLSLDTDKFYGTFDDLEYIETYAAIKMSNKEDSDSSALEDRRAKLWSRINNATKDADLGAPRRVRNVRKGQYIHGRR